MLGRLIKSRRGSGGRSEIERQVDEELRFHCEMLAEEYRESGMSEEAARAAVSERFGDRERVQAECVEISMRNRPFMRLLKLMLLLFFVCGIWLRIVAPHVNFKQVADLLMAISVLGQLLLHAKSLRGAASLSLKGSSPLSIMGRGAHAGIEPYDEQGRTPVERLVADRVFKDS